MLVDITGKWELWLGGGGCPTRQLGLGSTNPRSNLLTVCACDVLCRVV